MRISSCGVHAGARLMVLSFMTTGCENEETVVQDGAPNNGRVIGSIHGRVMDVVTGLLLEDVTVTWADDGGVHGTTTNDMGYYAIQGLDPGNYVLTFSREEGYATQSVVVAVPTLEDIGIVDIPTEDDFRQTIQRDVELPPLSSTVGGRFYEDPGDGTLMAADGITVALDFSAFNLSPALYTTTTDGDGDYLFEDLPATATAVLRVADFIDGFMSFEGHEALVQLVPGGTAQLADVVLGTLQVEPMIVAENLTQEPFPIHGNLELSFDKAMNPDDFAARLQGVGVVELALGWSADHRSLTIDPDEDLRLDQAYTLTMAGRAEDQSAYAEVIVFITQEGIALASSNLQAYDGFYAIDEDDQIILHTTEPIDPSDSRNQFLVNGLDVAAAFLDGNLTVVINAPETGWPGPQIVLFVDVYSTLADYDHLVFNRTVQIQ